MSLIDAEALVRSSQDAILVKDLDAHIVSWNPAAERLYGYTEAEALGRPVAMLVPPELEGEERQILDDVLAGRPVDHFETDRLRKDGTRLRVSLTVSAVRDEHGAIIGASAIARDVGAQRALRQAQAHLAALVEASGEAIMAVDAQARVSVWNAAAAELFGLAASEAVGRRVPDVLAGRWLARALRGETVRYEARRRRRQDELRIAMTVSPVRDDRQRVVGAVAVSRDVTEQQRLAEALARREQHARFLAEASERLAASLDPVETLGTLTSLLLPSLGDVCLAAVTEDAALRVVGLEHVDALTAARFRAMLRQVGNEMSPTGPAHEVVDSGRPLLVGDVDIGLKARYSSTRDHSEMVGLLDLRSIAVAPIRAAGEVLGVLEVMTSRAHSNRVLDDEDVALLQAIADRGGQALLNARLHEAARELADHDALTGVLNRRRFGEELDRVAADCRRYGTSAALLIVDLDHLKDINDIYGHAVGDELLCCLAGVLRMRCRETDVVGRLGGDEFGVILPHSGPAEAEATARALVAAVRDGCSVVVGGRDVTVTASIGLRTVPPDTEVAADALLAEADIALYDAKEQGRDRVSVVTEGSPQPSRVRARLAWSERIRDALRGDGLALWEQPILGLAAGRVERTEVLLRMIGDDGSVIAPGAFLEVAERFGQIQELDRWVIGRAVALLEQRRSAGVSLGMEVNLSGASITDSAVIDFIVSTVRAASIDPTLLTFEVTETAAITNIARARELAARLADLGCQFALDDFGSGFGSFYYLKHLPFDVVKIDGDFVRDLPSSTTDRLTVQAIVQIARGMGKQTVAEFVQDAETVAVLRELGVDFAQGYFVGRPAPAVVVPEW